MRTSVCLGFLVGPCAHVAGSGAGGASVAGGREGEWVTVAACLTCVTSNKALSLLDIVGMGAGAGGTSVAGGKEVDWVTVAACLTCATSNKARSLVAIVGMGAGAGGASGAGDRAMD